MLALRKKQCSEMAEVVRCDLATQSPTGDVPRRLKAIEDELNAINGEPDPNVFNENAKFVEVTKATLAQLPCLGDEVEALDVHTKSEEEHDGRWPRKGRLPPSITALATLAGGSEREFPMLISGRSDGVAVVYGESAGPRTEEFCRQPNGSGPSSVPTPVLCTEVLTPYSIVAAGLFDHTVALLRLDATAESQRLFLHAHADPVTALAWKQEPLWLASGSMGKVVVWELDAAQLRKGGGLGEAEPRHCILEGHADTVRSLAWLPHDLLASGSLDCTIRLWRLAKDPISGQLSGECVHSIDQHHSGPVTGLALGTRPNGVGDTVGEAVLVSVSTDRSICVWNPHVDHNFKKTVDERLRCHDLGICAVSAMANHQVATASADTTVKTWQLMLGGTKPEPLGTLRGHIGAVHSLCYISSKGWLASGGKDTRIRLWRAHAAAPSMNSDADAIVTRAASETIPARQQPESEPDKACKHLAVVSRGANIRSLSAKFEAGSTDDSDGVLFIERHQKLKQQPKSRQSTSGTTPLRTGRTPQKQRDPPPLPDNRNDGTQARSANRALTPKRPARAPKGVTLSKP
eukprot:SAG11_NODE_504_length_8890_cov_8.268229_5_plen_575_part_00